MSKRVPLEVGPSPVAGYPTGIWVKDTCHFVAAISRFRPSVGPELVDAYNRAPEMAEELEKLEATVSRLLKDRAAILTVTSTNGLSCSEWLMRTATAEAQRDELKAKMEYVADRLEQEPADVLHGGKPMIDQRCVQAHVNTLRAAIAKATP